MKRTYVLINPFQVFDKKSTVKEIEEVLETLPTIPLEHRRQMSQICEGITEHGFVVGGGFFTAGRTEAEIIHADLQGVAGPSSFLNWFAEKEPEEYRSYLQDEEFWIKHFHRNVRTVDTEDLL